MKSFTRGPLLVMIAASLWALDALIRTKLTKTMSSEVIVMLEHVIGFLILSLLCIPIYKNFAANVKKLTPKDWLVVILMATVSSVGGGLFFTEALKLSFATFDFVTPLLLQQLQPIFVVLLSAIILREKISIKFILLSISALIGAYMVKFGGESIDLTITHKELVFIFSILACLFWGFGTILSKYTLRRLSTTEATTLRFAVAIPASIILPYVLQPVSRLLSNIFNTEYVYRTNFSSIKDVEITDILWITLIAFTTGAAAILIYYRGLRHTEAKVSTIAELMFPIISLLIAITSLNPYGQPQILLLANVFGIIILLNSILLIGFENNEK